MKYTQVSAIVREKTKKCCAWGHESVRISVIKRVCSSRSLFQSFLYAFRRGAGSCPHEQDVRNSEVSEVSTACIRHSH